MFRKLLMNRNQELDYIIVFTIMLCICAVFSTLLFCGVQTAISAEPTKQEFYYIRLYSGGQIAREWKTRSGCTASEGFIRFYDKANQLVIVGGTWSMETVKE